MMGVSVSRTQTTTSASHRVLLVDDDDAVRTMMSLTLEHKGFEVVSAANVTEALKLITTESFDVLITDLHMPNPSDGFAVITAMRHIQPKALTLLVSGYTDVKSAMDAIFLEADEIIVKPFETKTLANLVHDKLLTRAPTVPTPKERVAAILQRCSALIVEDWLAKVKKSNELSFATLQKNLGALDFSLLLPDVMTIADEVDSQLTQAMESYMSVVLKPAAAHRLGLHSEKRPQRREAAA
jgi:DNA-binding response OmpR family regulator